MEPKDLYLQSGGDYNNNTNRYTAIQQQQSLIKTNPFSYENSRRIMNLLTQNCLTKQVCMWLNGKHNMVHNECSYCFVTMKLKVRNDTVVIHTAYNECFNQYVVTMKTKVIALATSLALVLILGALTTLHTQFAFARVVLTPGFWGIQSANSSGYMVCNPNCHLSSNSGSDNSDVEAAYRLTVNVPSHPFGTSTVGISITTENGHTDQANVPTAGGLSYTFNIPENQGKSVQVCVKPGNLSVKNCHTYKTTGSDMSVSLPAVSSTSSGTNYRHIGPWSGGGGYDAYLPPSFGYP